MIRYAHEAHYGRLINRTVTGIVSEGGLFGMRLDNGLVAWITRDEAGDKPGHLAILPTPIKRK
jgi:hypothetical protein